MSDGDLFDEVLKIKTDVRSLQHQTSWLLRSEANELEKYWKPAFGLIPGKRPNFMAMRVYLAVNGKRTVSEIADVADVHRPDASKNLTQLEKIALVEPLPQKTSSTKIYAKTPADRALGISRALQAAIDANVKTKSAKAGGAGAA